MPWTTEGIDVTNTAPPAGTAPKADGTVENGGIWYHGNWFPNVETLRYTAEGHGWTDAGWAQFLQSNPSYAAWAGGTGTNPVPNPTHTGADGEIDDATGGIWYGGKLYSGADRLNLRSAFPDDDAWRAWLNANPQALNWWNQAGGGGTATGGTGTGGGTGGTSTVPVPKDWSIILGTLGLPPEIVTELNNIWTKSGGDSTVATPLAMNYVMTTQWFKDNYPGYFTGLNKGMWGDIRGYVSYQNDVGQTYQQYFGRAITNAELIGYIDKGWDSGKISAQFKAQSVLGAIPDPLKGVFSPEELKAYSDQVVGIDSALGAKMIKEVDLYMSLSPMFQSFYHRAPTRAELDTLTANGTDPSQVSQQFKAAGFLDAIDPSVRNLFTPDELQEIANQNAGMDTQHGQELTKLLNLASSLNPIYQMHSGAPVTRDEVNQAYAQGYTPDYIKAQLDSGVFAATLPANVKSMFTPEELKLATDQMSGASASAEGARMLNLVNQASGFAPLATRYGRTLDRSQIENFYNTGFSANDYSNQLQGESWAAANAPDIQQATGSYGEGELTTEQMGKLGAERAGLDTPEGAKLLAAYNKTLQRMNGVFTGVMARSSGFSSTQARRGVVGVSPDVGA